MASHDTIPDAHKMKSVWLDGKLVPSAEAVVPIMAYTLHYGLGVFEGIRTYDGAKGPAVFRLREHMERLHRSANLVRMEIPFSVDALCEGATQLLADNGLRAGYLRPIAFVDDGKRGLGAMNNRIRVGIVCWPWGAYLGDEGIKKGIRCQVSSVARMNARSFLPKGKINGQYVNSILAKRLAMLGGYDEAILLDDQGLVAEASGENVFLVEKGELITPPTSQPILEGITRDTILQLAARLGITARERSFSREALYTADEVFLCGTAAEITPVRDVDGHAVGSGSRGPITERLQSTYNDVVHARVHELQKWNTTYAVNSAASA